MTCPQRDSPDSHGDWLFAPTIHDGIFPFPCTFRVSETRRDHLGRRGAVGLWLGATALQHGTAAELQAWSPSFQATDSGSSGGVRFHCFHIPGDKHIMPSSLLPLPSTLPGEAWSRGTRRTNERRRQVRHRRRLSLAATGNSAKDPGAGDCMHGWCKSGAIGAGEVTAIWQVPAIQATKRDTPTRPSGMAASIS